MYKTGPKGAFGNSGRGKDSMGQHIVRLFSVKEQLARLQVSNLLCIFYSNQLILNTYVYMVGTFQDHVKKKKCFLLRFCLALITRKESNIKRLFLSSCPLLGLSRSPLPSNLLLLTIWTSTSLPILVRRPYMIFSHMSKPSVAYIWYVLNVYF